MVSIRYKSSRASDAVFRSCQRAIETLRFGYVIPCTSVKIKAYNGYTMAVISTIDLVKQCT